ncbi:MAG: hypothetical protein JO202_02705 [Ktedonobacteraceae bacterium]|nr:hypothetical protein [Ktedonobacteraceae bacterium]
MITQVEIDGFKTFKDFKVELAPFQVIVGPSRTAEQVLIQYGRKQMDTLVLPVALTKDQKQKLKAIVQKAYANRTKRKRDVDIDFLYQPMGEKIKLERLHLVPSYDRFVKHLIAILKVLEFIQ